MLFMYNEVETARKVIVYAMTSSYRSREQRAESVILLRVVDELIATGSADAPEFMARVSMPVPPPTPVHVEATAAAAVVAPATRPAAKYRKVQRRKR